MEPAEPLLLVKLGVFPVLLPGQEAIAVSAGPPAWLICSPTQDRALGVSPASLSSLLQCCVSSLGHILVVAVPLQNGGVIWGIAGVSRAFGAAEPPCSAGPRAPVESGSPGPPCPAVHVQLEGSSHSKYWFSLQQENAVSFPSAAGGEAKPGDRLLCRQNLSLLPPHPPQSILPLDVAVPGLVKGM